MNAAADPSQLYLVHWPVAFKQGDAYFPRIEGSTVEGGDVVIDDEVSIVDTWKGQYLHSFAEKPHRRPSTCCISC